MGSSSDQRTYVWMDCLREGFELFLYRGCLLRFNLAAVFFCFVYSRKFPLTVGK